MLDAKRPYVVVLAGGEGSRLASLTRALYGTELPKQFAVLDGERSLLQTTIERATALTTLDRILVVVTAHHRALAQAQLAPFPGVELVVQPRNLDTAPGMLLPLARIMAREPGARVVFLPSDHFIADPAPIVRALLDSAAGQLGDRLALIGVAPTGPEVEYGWIVPGGRLGKTQAFAVQSFREKPETEVAETLWRSGGLWNTFIQVGPARVFWQLARKNLPHHAVALERYATAIGRRDEHDALETTYRAMAPANFSRDILAHAGSLAVMPVANSGWSDWGSPQRVFASLHGTAAHTRLVERIRGDALVLAG
jgi:mannose-1-phosphate guanylyltransferase